MTQQNNSDTLARRFKDADAIWSGGASNRMAVANALMRAIEECRAEGNYDCHDPAVTLILDHLCFLCGLPQPSFQMSNEELEAALSAIQEKVS